MAIYMIAKVEITEHGGFMDYQDRAKESIEAAGGRMLIRNGVPETVEGESDGRKIVMLEFPSRNMAEAWWSSPEYREIAAMREGKANVEAIIVEGV